MYCIFSLQRYRKKQVEISELVETISYNDDAGDSLDFGRSSLEDASNKRKKVKHPET